MEKIKLSLDIGITIFGILAALFAVLSLIYSSKIDYAKKNEEERLKSKIAESNAFAEKAKEEAAKALASAANTNERSKKLELKVEEQKERAANAEKELITLKEKIKPRAITEEKAKKLIVELKKFSDKEIHISSSLGDGEAALYASQIKNIFEFAGWKVGGGIGHSSYTGVGVYMLIKAEDNNTKQLKKVFGHSGADLQEQIMDNADKVQIFVGSKSNLDLDSN